MFKTMKEVIEEQKAKKLEKYPLVQKAGTQLKDSSTNGRVTYDNGYFELWVYPTIEIAENSYDFECHSFIELCTRWIPHLIHKRWFTYEIQSELTNLGREVFEDGVRL